MALLEDMQKALADRINNAAKPYQQVIYMSDVHYNVEKSNAGFDSILKHIQDNERKQTLCVVLGGDMIDNGKTANYTAFVAKCKKFLKDSGGIPIIPAMGNHEFYSVPKTEDAISRYKKYIGDVNFRTDISAKGLPASLSIVTFNDAKPHKYDKVYYPDVGKGKNCVTTSNIRHLFYFPHAYIRFDKNAPKKYSGFPDFIKNSPSDHIVVTSHVPPRKNPLWNMLTNYIAREFKACLAKNPVISLADLQVYFRDLWMLVHGNSKIPKGGKLEVLQNDSTQWYVDVVKNQKKVEMLLMGHVHTYYPFRLDEANHQLDVVISGGGGNGSCKTYDPQYPCKRLHYLRIKYDEVNKRYYHELVNVGE